MIQVGDAAVAVSVGDIGVRKSRSGPVVLVGNPNTGKSSLFNRLTGLRQKTANYPGVTVEHKSGWIEVDRERIQLVDLPGTFAFGGASLDENITADVLLGALPSLPLPSGVVIVLDSTRLYQGLYFAQQVLELGLPTVIALTMTDIAGSMGISVNASELGQRLGGVPVVEVNPNNGSGCENLERAVAKLRELPPSGWKSPWPELERAVRTIQPEGTRLQRARLARELVSPAATNGEPGQEGLVGQRTALAMEAPLAVVEARRRYGWIRENLPLIQTQTATVRSLSQRVLSWLNEPLQATVLFFAVMVVVFQAVFAWATPLMDLIDGATAGLGAWVSARIPEGMLQSFIVDGVIAGVGSVIIFLPQILTLFLFLILLEDTGYLARAAFLMDRAMSALGLSGLSVIPMLSSFACAVPGIMATRVIPNRRDRFATILAAPFMTCSARLPVYALLIAAFVPAGSVGFLNLQGLVLFGLYLLGIVGGIVTALLLKRSVLKGERPTFFLGLPDFRWPNWRSVLIKLADRARVFLRRAGTIIFAVAVVVWALAYFPRTDVEISVPANATAEQVLQIENEAAAEQLRQSWLGRAGRALEPVFAPLGWDWRVSAAVIAGFPAREVVVAVMGTIFAVGSEADELTLSERLKGATHPDGTPLFTLPMVLGLLIFYAWCLQCAATLAVMRRETNSWRWPIFGWLYMTGLGYLGALLVFQLGS